MTWVTPRRYDRPVAAVRDALRRVSRRVRASLRVPSPCRRERGVGLVSHGRPECRASAWPAPARRSRSKPGTARTSSSTPTTRRSKSPGGRSPSAPPKIPLSVADSARRTSRCAIPSPVRPHARHAAARGVPVRVGLPRRRARLGAHRRRRRTRTSPSWFPPRPRCSIARIRGGAGYHRRRRLSRRDAVRRQPRRRHAPDQRHERGVRPDDERPARSHRLELRPLARPRQQRELHLRARPRATDRGHDGVRFDRLRRRHVRSGTRTVRIDDRFDRDRRRSRRTGGARARPTVTSTRCGTGARRSTSSATTKRAPPSPAAVRSSTRSPDAATSISTTARWRRVKRSRPSGGRCGKPWSARRLQAPRAFERFNRLRGGRF